MKGAPRRGPRALRRTTLPVRTEQEGAAGPRPAARGPSRIPEACGERRRRSSLCPENALTASRSALSGASPAAASVVQQFRLAVDVGPSGRRLPPLRRRHADRQPRRPVRARARQTLTSSISSQQKDTQQTEGPLASLGFKEFQMHSSSRATTATTSTSCSISPARGRSGSRSLLQRRRAASLGPGAPPPASVDRCGSGAEHGPRFVGVARRARGLRIARPGPLSALRLHASSAERAPRTAAALRRTSTQFASCSVPAGRDRRSFADVLVRLGDRPRRRGSRAHEAPQSSRAAFPRSGFPVRLRAARRARGVIEGGGGRVGPGRDGAGGATPRRGRDAQARGRGGGRPTRRRIGDETPPRWSTAGVATDEPLRRHQS